MVPDLVVYQAGADSHIDDPLGTLEITTDQMFSRDHIVYSFCRQKKIPVMFVLAGGYQEPIETKLVSLHLNTFRAAKAVYVGNVGVFEESLLAFSQSGKRLRLHDDIPIAQT